MFTRIASRYDLLNRLMTLGQDAAWRRQTIRRIDPQPGHRVLDIGTGTGDLARQALQHQPHCRAVAADFTPEMLRVGRQQRDDPQIDWVVADAAHLPFQSGSFDGVVSGFLLRNVPDLEPVLAEQIRVLAGGGAWAALDTTRPPNNWLRPLLNLHFSIVIPLLGRLLAGDAEAYTYLPDSTRQFLTAEDLAERIRAAGMTVVGFTRRMLGTVAIHWGTRKDGKH
jgi:demethylmenaquinone methyltransferase/2-methoxy-6-polyprenyl-1,4-benzoquinol methylase